MKASNLYISSLLVQIYILHPISSPNDFTKVPGRGPESQSKRRSLFHSLIRKTGTSSPKIKTKSESLSTNISTNGYLPGSKGQTTKKEQKDPTIRRFAFRPNAKTHGGRSNVSRLPVAEYNARIMWLRTYLAKFSVSVAVGRRL